MIEQKLSRGQQAKEFIKGLGIFAQLLFDPRTDPNYPKAGHLIERTRERFVIGTLLRRLKGGQDG